MTLLLHFASLANFALIPLTLTLTLISVFVSHESELNPAGNSVPLW